MAKRRRKKRFNIKYFFEDVADFFLRRKSLVIILSILVVLFLAGVIALKYISDNYTVTNVYVTGNSHYSNEEIMAMVMDGQFGHNSVYLSLKYRDKSIEDVPFIQKMSVEILSPDTIRINVYEKAIAGYIQYLGRYMYFDRDGIVVESSLESSDDVPLVLGLSFDHVIIHEKLPVENENIFAEILDITKLLSKYDLHAEKIFFDSEYDVYLYFGGVEVSLGTRDYIDEKIIQLQYILPSLEGKNGILEMKDYDEDTTNITFEEKTR
ncbi:cell division protein FtsQ/DivIB [Butyrivibrio sp. MC2021]|uniref:cell division protein FtsQ/DivIB n=1 Tax=Butyrivibrio sp. MC2021 TaxID=1408306 RepID=UPI0006875822|nr:FtsQ-type POTRA domain-containing protein [Butyrivibrio sp. MC2021]